jgi:hypothetical protein
MYNDTALVNNDLIKSHLFHEILQAVDEIINAKNQVLEYAKDMRIIVAGLTRIM